MNGYVDAEGYWHEHHECPDLVQAVEYLAEEWVDHRGLWRCVACSTNHQFLAHVQVV